MAGAVLEGVELNSQNVERAVLQFYQSGASQETHKWLTLAQLSPLASRDQTDREITWRGLASSL